jgi:hypothetical protein
MTAQSSDLITFLHALENIFDAYCDHVVNARATPYPASEFDAFSLEWDEQHGQSAPPAGAH